MWPLFRRIFTLKPWGSSDNSRNTDTSTNVLHVPSAGQSYQGAVSTPGITRLESAISAPLKLSGTHESAGQGRHSGLDDIRGYPGSRPRGQNSLGIEDIDIDVELGRLETAHLRQSSRLNIASDTWATTNVPPALVYGSMDWDANEKCSTCKDFQAVKTRIWKT